MKVLFSCCAILALVASPAFAGDAVSKSTLDSLGLGGIEVISDAEAMEVRGMSSSAAAFGASLVFGIALDPAVPGSFLVAADVNGNVASSTDGGSGIMSSAFGGPQGSAAAGSVTTVPSGFSSAFLGGAGAGGGGGFSFGSAF